MELSHDHRFIFVHVYRVAGQSISQALAPYAFDPARRIRRVPVVRKLASGHIVRKRWLWEHYHGHIKAKELKEALPPEVFEPYFKFAFVRNPWAWQVSIYHYVVQNADHPDHERYRALGSFERYLDWRVNDAGPELQQEFVLSDDGELLVDLVGRYETLHDDFAAVCGRIGIPCALAHRNASSHDDFRRYYTEATRALVGDAYREDIERFGYDFEEERRLAPILGPAEAERAQGSVGVGAQP